MPSQVIPLWREFVRCTPNPSHFGVDLTHLGTVWRRVGGRQVPNTKYQLPVLLASSQQLGASSFFCQRPFNALLFRSGANFQLYHLFALKSSKNVSVFTEKCLCTRGGADIYACGKKTQLEPPSSRRRPGVPDTRFAWGVEIRAQPKAERAKKPRFSSPFAPETSANYPETRRK